MPTIYIKKSSDSGPQSRSFSVGDTEIIEGTTIQQSDLVTIGEAINSTTNILSMAANVLELSESTTG